MTAGPVLAQALSLGVLSFAAVILLLASAACSDRSVPPSLSLDRATLGGSSGPRVHASSTELETSIRALIDSGDPALGLLMHAERLELHELYRVGGYLPLWLDATGRPDRDAREMLALHDAVADEGLDSADYGRVQLDRLMALLESTSPASPTDLARFDVAVSSGALRYLRHLHMGRVDPRAIGFRLSVPVDQHDFAALVRGALATHRLADLAAGLRPPLAQYQALRMLLVQYRRRAADTTLEPPPPSSTVVRPGEAYDGVGQLWRLLVAVGDLPPGTPASSADAARYDGWLVEGVKRFQVRHGLEVDGILGKRTLAALRTPVAWRVRQIELALERLRWLPHLGERRLIALNIPMFRLWAWDSIPPTGVPLFGMDVIVGRALSTETPVFLAEMREVIFRPYWNVPRSILRGEILPMIERDPDYLQRANMEIVDGPGDNATPVDLTAESLVRLRQGTLRLRQRPGPQNALGLIKFVSPNEENVYMHGTPAQALFARSRRDFSHGCVRVEDPVTLAEWALKETPAWNRERIFAATTRSRSIHVKLARPIQVILFYTTAAVMPEDGMIRFAEDIYRHDIRLDRALTTRDPVH